MWADYSAARHPWRYCKVTPFENRLEGDVDTLRMWEERKTQVECNEETETMKNTYIKQIAEQR